MKTNTISIISVRIWSVYIPSLMSNRGRWRLERARSRAYHIPSLPFVPLRNEEKQQILKVRAKHIETVHDTGQCWNKTVCSSHGKDGLILTWELTLKCTSGSASLCLGSFPMFALASRDLLTFGVTCQRHFFACMIVRFFWDSIILMDGWGFFLARRNGQSWKRRHGLWDNTTEQGYTGRVGPFSCTSRQRCQNDIS